MTSKETITLGTKIRSIVDLHAVPARAAKAGVESGTLDSLAKRLALPDREHVAALIQSGRLRSFGAVHRNDPSGPHRFSTAELNEIKREVLGEIAGQVVMEFSGAPAGLPAAVSAALSAYVKSIADGTAPKGLSRKLPARVRSFAYSDPREERPGLLRRVATGAAVAGGLYAGASYLRGRKIGARGLLPSVKAGNAANVADARKLAGRAAGFIRPRGALGFSVVTPAHARALLLQFGRRLRGAA